MGFDSNVAIIGHPGAQSAHFYEQRDHDWTHLTTITGPSGFGTDVGIDGDLAVVVAPAASEIHVLRRDGGEWQLNSTVRLPGRACFYDPVDIQGTRIAVGLPCSSTILVYDWDGLDWAETAIPGPSGSRSFGSAVALTEDTVFATSRNEVYSVQLNGLQEQTLITERSARSIAATEGRLAVATSSELVLFENGSSGWTEKARLTASDASPFDGHTSFGRALSLRGDAAVVGAWEDDPLPGHPAMDPAAEHPCVYNLGSHCLPPKSGAVYVFEQIAGIWQQTAKVVGDPTGDDRFGSAVALGPDVRTLLAGAPGRTLPSSAGFNVDLEDAVHVFKRGGD